MSYDIDKLVAEAKEKSEPARRRFCPACECRAEEWWNYCAECGYHIASGRIPASSET